LIQKLGRFRESHTPPLVTRQENEGHGALFSKAAQGEFLWNVNEAGCHCSGDRPGEGVGKWVAGPGTRTQDFVEVGQNFQRVFVQF